MYKLPHAIRGNLPKSMIIFFIIYSTVIHFTSAFIVHVNYTRHNSTDRLVPEKLNLTLHRDSGSPIHIRLKRVQHINSNIPVYTYTTGPDGSLIHKREQLKDHKKIGYYQDASNDAAIQVTVADGQDDEEEEEGHLYLRGELNIAGTKYTLSPERRFKRTGPLFNQQGSPSSTPPPDSGESYNLLPQIMRPAVHNDYIEAPPELIRKTVETSRHEVPESLLLSDTLLSSKSTSSQQRSSKRFRRQQQSAQTYYVDIVAVADYAIYSRFLADSASKAEALQAMREYYAFIFNGVDLRYQSIVSVNYVIRVRLIKLIITETAGASSFTEQFRVSSRPWDEVDAQRVLTAFSNFVTGSGSDIVNPYDHAMLFTGYDLTSTLTSSPKTNATTGLAFTGTLCRLDGKSSSVVEDLGGFQSVDTAAHELGHSLSARHDGDGNTCKSSDRFIMANGSTQMTESNKFNPWLFSSCSSVFFTNFISDIIKTMRGETCLMLTLSISAGIPDVSNRLPGQEFSPDDQCRMIYGNASRLCRGTEFSAVENICTAMFCYDPSTTGVCYEQTAAMGTTCGDGKLCLNGHCVLDSRAPSVDENCVFGDQPGNAFDKVSCPDFVNRFNGYCYQAVVKGRCCSSCKMAYRTVRGCEYGDTVRGCNPTSCSFAPASYLEQCCGSCNYGTHFTLPPTTKRVTQNASKKSPSSGRLTTIEPKKTIIHIDPDKCEDNPSMFINDLSCTDAVAANPKLCYKTDVNIGCCASCDKVYTGVAGTEFGGQEENNVYGDGVEEYDEQDEKSSKNYPQEDENEEVREEGETIKCKQEEEVRNQIENEGLERYDEINNGDQEEMMAKSNVALAIHISPSCEYGDLYPSSCRLEKSCDGISKGCCQTCSTTFKPTSETSTGLSSSAPKLPCIDQLNVLVNNMTCDAAIRQFPFYCYNNHVLDTCCFSCKQKIVTVKDCEYGDHTPQKCNSTLSSSSCQKLGTDCCATCASKAPRDIINLLSPLLMALCYHIFTSVLSRSATFL